MSRRFADRFFAVIAVTIMALIMTPIHAHGQVVEIVAGQDIQSVVDLHSPGTTFILKSGTHRMQTIRPRTGDTFLGERDTVLSGARVLTDFVPLGNLWVADGQTQEGIKGRGICEYGRSRCNYPEDLFINGERLEPVGSPDAIAAPDWSARPGDWYFDYEADRIYISYDPTWLRVETSVTATAFEPTGDNVTIRGLTIAMYASIAQHGAIDGTGRNGWIVEDNAVWKNHGAGIRVGSGAQVRRNYVAANGQIGIAGAGDDILVEGNEIHFNGLAGYEHLWESGGLKFGATRGLVVRDNFVHHNDGVGLWSDCDSVNTLYQNNRSEDNALMGIFVEISYTAIIRNNTVRRNGFGYPDWLAGAGILVAASSDVEVYGNDLGDNADGIGGMQQSRGFGPYGAHELWNLWVHHNRIEGTRGWTGIVQDIGDSSVFTSRNNRFEYNTYSLGVQPSPFTWMDRELNKDEWGQYGQDVLGTFSNKEM